MIITMLFKQSIWLAGPTLAHFAHEIGSVSLFSVSIGDERTCSRSFFRVNFTRARDRLQFFIRETDVEKVQYVRDYGYGQLFVIKQHAVAVRKIIRG